jgi:nucleotide-binding universal stress UspA family protein
MRILYATDGSEGGLAAGRFLAGLTQSPDTEVHIVTIAEIDDPDNYSASALDGAVAALGDFPGSRTTNVVRVSSGSTSEVVDALLTAADYREAGLIAIGASGQSAIARFFLGSVAESVARHARCPVLITRPTTAPLQEVVVGIDGSDGAQAAAEFVALQFPLPAGCRVRLVSVATQPLFGVAGDPQLPGTPDYAILERANRETRNRAQIKAKALAETLRREDRQQTVEVEPPTLGNPAVELVRIAEERGAGLIAVGSQGLTGIERFLLGSVSERVLRLAKCSVLVVK